MSANIPVLPIAAGTLVRGFASLLAIVTRWLKKLLRTRRHWREATALANLDRRMLADLGITRADLRDAFSEPLWQDPTALLRARALERRLSSHGISLGFDSRSGGDASVAPRTDRPSRLTV